MRRLLVLLILLTVAAFLRLYDLNNLPTGLHWDELDTGYQAYSLLTTGKDYFGNPLPLFPHSFADYRTPVYIYSAVPFVASLGLTETATRLPAVMWSIIALVSLAALGKLVSGTWTTGYLATFFMAVSMWHLQYSRKSVETGSLLALSTLATALFLRGLKKPISLLFSALFFALATAAYSPGKLFVPLFVAALLLIYRRQLRVVKTHALTFLVVLTIVSAPIYLDGLFGKSGMRFHDLSIFTDPTIPSEINLQRLDFALASGVPLQVGMQPRVIDKALYNKPVEWSWRIIRNYLTTFSTDFLFIKGDPEARHSPAKDSIGMLHLVEIVPLLLGFIYIAIRLNTPSSKLVLAWLLLAPLPAALTRDGGNHAARLLILLPALILTITHGVVFLRQKSKLLVALFALSFFVFAFSDLAYYFTRYRFESAGPFQWSFKPAIELALKYSSEYPQVYVDLYRDTGLMAYLFYSRFPPADFQSLHPIPDYKPESGLEGKKFNNIIFLNPGERRWNTISLSTTALVIGESHLPSLDKWEPKVNTVYFNNAMPALFIFVKPAYEHD